MSLTSSVGLCNQIYENEKYGNSPLLVLPVASVTLGPRTFRYPNGNAAQVAVEVSSGEDFPLGEPWVATAKIRQNLGVGQNGAETFPVRKIVAVPQETDSSSVQLLKSYVTNVLPSARSGGIELVKLPTGEFQNWFVRNNNIVYTTIRFVLNGATIGATMIYSLNVPLANALLLGLLAGSMSGLIQYNVVKYRDWLESDAFVRNFKIETYDWESPLKNDFKEFYNDFLSVAGQYTKFGLSETVFVSLARLAMWLLNIPSQTVGFKANLVNVIKTSIRSTVAQGVAELGLFKDLEVQKAYGGWSDQFAALIRNTSVFLISAASVAVAALQLVRPELGGVIELGFFELPVGFAAITTVGLGFYLHALLTYWLARWNRF